jgi:nicotinic acid mononucleotide adenylyltransferase
MVPLWRLAHSLDPSAPATGTIARALKQSDRATRALLASASRALLIPGSFNPITNAHLALADAGTVAGASQADLPGSSLVIWSGAVATIDKESVERASWPDRLAQLVALSEMRPGEHPQLVLLFNRGLYLDQLRALRAMLRPDATIHAIVGFDKIVQIFDPRYYTDRDATLHELFALASFLVAPRDGAGVNELAVFLARSENRPWADHVRPLPIPEHFDALSSTHIRTLAATEPNSVELRSIVPPEALALIRETGAYSRFPADAPDLYTLRQQWLPALSALPVHVLRALPPISALVRRAAAQDEVGAAIRSALADGRWARDPEQAEDDLRAFGLLRRKTPQDSGG